MISIVLVVLIIIVAYGGRFQGVMERPVAAEASFITILLAPMLMDKVEKQLISFGLGETLAMILSFIISTLIFYILAKIILEKIVKIAKHPHQGMDKFLGMMFKALKAYLVIAMLILLFGGLSLDRLIPIDAVNRGFKENFVNNRIKNVVEFYRYKVYSTYKGVKEAEVTDLNKKSQWAGEARRKTAVDYTSWVVKN